VIVVTHESAGQIEACLASLRQHPCTRGQEVIVVDNASTDGTTELIAQHFPEVLVTAPRRRQGFAANCNYGARLATGRTLLFLNPDARVTPGVIDRLVELLQSDPAIAIAGPRLVYPDGSAQPSARRFPTPLATLVRRSPLRWVMRDSAVERRHLMMDRGDDHTEGDQPSDVDWLLGAAIAVRAPVYQRLGGMDEGYRLYCEDIDLCWRAWEAGLRVVQVSSATVVHDLTELTRRRFTTRATLWHLRSMARFVSLHGLPIPESTRPNGRRRNAESVLAYQQSDAAGQS
jgi:GT2 family glycosyltransferase